jgi:hypothetical protein
MASHDVNCRFQGADGAYRWFNVRGEPLRDSDGRNPSRFDGGRHGAQVGLCRQVGEVIFLLS